MESKKVSKRVNLVSVKLIKEGSILYEPRRISSPKDAFELGKEFLIDSDREKLILVCWDNNNQPTSINKVSIGSLNSSIVHPREVFKVAILSNSASIIVYHNLPSGDVGWFLLSKQTSISFSLSLSIKNSLPNSKASLGLEILL